MAEKRSPIVAEKPTSELENAKHNLETVLHKSNFCCVCYESASILQGLRSSPPGELPGIVKLSYVFGDQISKEIPSQTICEQCNNELDSAYSFVQKVKTNAKNLQSLLQQLASKLDEVTNKNNCIQLTLPKQLNDVALCYEEEYDCIDSVNEYHCDDIEDSEPVKQKSIIDKKQFECDYCGWIANSKKRIRNHIFTHLSNTNRNNKVKNVEDLMRKCYLCPMALKGNKLLREHLSTHGPNEKYYCKDCDKYFDTRFKYMRHRNNYGHKRKAQLHTNLPHKCVKCNELFISDVTLENHMNNIHFKQKPHRCDVCNKHFSSEINLKCHVARHSGVKKFECDKCNMKFTAKMGLKYHNKRFHSDGMSFVCELCASMFVSLSQLNLHHQRKHSSKTEACPICATLFGTIYNLRMHVRRVHLKNSTLDEYVSKNGSNKKLEDLFIDRRSYVIDEL